MISFLRGIVAGSTDNAILVDVNGVGYLVYASNEAIASVQTGKEAKIIIYEHIKEDAYDLYGFVDASAKALFQQLISVNGVGPKMGLNIMNIGSSQDLRAAIANGDTKFIQAASGVGKRLAERLVVDLKDKVGLAASSEATSFLGGVNAQDEALQALMALGYSDTDASEALSGTDKSLSTEERIRIALGAGRRR